MSKNFRIWILMGILAVAIISCSDDKDKNSGKGGNGKLGTVDVTLDLLKGENDNEIIVRCTPAMPYWETGFGPCYFNQQGKFYELIQTGGDEGLTVMSNPNDDPGWNSNGTEYTYHFSCYPMGEWEGTITLAPVDTEWLKEINIGSMNIKSITIGKNDPVPLKLGW